MTNKYNKRIIYLSHTNPNHNSVYYIYIYEIKLKHKTDKLTSLIIMYLCIQYSQDNININIFYETLTTLFVTFTEEIFDIKGYVFFDRIA